MMEDILHADRDPNLVHDGVGLRALTVISMIGDVHSLQALLAKGVNMNHIEVDGSFPLLVASQNGHAECVQALLEKGANANQINEQSGNFPLLQASQNGHAECVQALLEKGANANQIHEQSGNFSLLMAVVKEHPQVLRVLIAARADVHKTMNGMTVFEAARAGFISPSEEVMQILTATQRDDDRRKCEPDP